VPKKGEEGTSAMPIRAPSLRSPAAASSTARLRASETALGMAVRLACRTAAAIESLLFA